tara:strand:+ start:269 stop:427 length:159 start_codon:yes stop_codon:yes gene_type:complete
MTERILWSAIGVMVLMCSLYASSGRDIGDYEKLQLVKLKAQQETVALRSHIE